MEFKDKSEYTYSDLEINAKVIGLFKDGVKVDTIDDEGEVIFDKTNFYAEMGGQVADTGSIEGKDAQAEVLNVTKAPNKQHLHHVKMLFGALKVGDELTLKVDHAKHFAIEKNHSATHLLQSALIKVLGDECHQKGSFVNEEYLRFDFSFLRKVDEIELKKVEHLVNEFIARGIEEKTLVLPIEEAKKVGAISLFDEKYGDEVRVVTFGNVSKEFCGGTHVKNSSDIGLFKIVSEGSISSGVRRIEARTGLLAYEEFKNKEDRLVETKHLLDAKADIDISQKISNFKENLANLNLKLEKMISEFAGLKSESILKDINENGFAVVYSPDFNKAGLLSLLDTIKARTNSYIVVLIGKENEKYPLIVGVSKDHVDQGIIAGNLVKKITSVLGGNGGGRKDMAQGSVVSLDKISLINKELLTK